MGIGLAMMIDAGFGVAPADAFFTGVSRTSGLTVGTVLFLVSIVMVIGSWALGIKPAIGSLVTFVGIAVVVDATRAVLALMGAPDWSMLARIPLWVGGLTLFCAGVMGIFGSNLGTSPYDQVVRAVALRTGRSLGFGRAIVDVLAFTGALLLGGSWGWGTVVILVTVPLALNLVLPRYRRLLGMEVAEVDVEPVG